MSLVYFRSMPSRRSSITKKIKTGTTYLHVPSGKRYRVIDLLPDATGYEKTHEVGESVRYEQLDDGEKFPAGTIWVRRVEDFLGKTIVDGREVNIFEESFIT